MLLVAFFLFVALWNVATVEAGQRYELSKRASELDTAAQEHPEERKQGADLRNAQRRAREAAPSPRFLGFA